MVGVASVNNVNKTRRRPLGQSAKSRAPKMPAHALVVEHFKAKELEFSIALCLDVTALFLTTFAHSRVEHACDKV